MSRSEKGKATLTADGWYAKWQADIEILKDRAYNLASAEDTFRQARAVAAVSPVLRQEPHLWEWILLAHVESALLRVRTFLDNSQHDAPSLLAMIREMRIHGEDVLTRERYLAEHGEDRWPFTGWGHKLFEQFAPPGAAAVPRGAFERDIRELAAATKAIETYVNTVVVHPKRTSRAVASPTWADYDNALDAIFDKVRKYYALLHHAGILALVPQPLTNWTRAFSESWLPKNVPRPEYRPVDSGSADDD